MSIMIDGRWMCLVDGVFTEEECARFIQELDRSAELRTVDSGFALYDRNIMISAAWAAVVRERIVGLLPEAVRDICVINDHFRFSKYLEGGYFDVHRDGVNVDASGNYAVYTVNVFLNAGFHGGQTEFFNAAQELVVRAEPKAGRGAIFDTNIYHRGCQVSGCYKYLLRTDVMVPRQRMVVQV